MSVAVFTGIGSRGSFALFVVRCDPRRFACPTFGLGTATTKLITVLRRIPHPSGQDSRERLLVFARARLVQRIVAAISAAAFTNEPILG